MKYPEEKLIKNELYFKSQIYISDKKNKLI